MRRRSQPLELRNTDSQPRRSLPLLSLSPSPPASPEVDPALSLLPPPSATALSRRIPPTCTVGFHPVRSARSLPPPPRPARRRARTFSILSSLPTPLLPSHTLSHALAGPHATQPGQVALAAVRPSVVEHRRSCSRACRRRTRSRRARRRGGELGSEQGGGSLLVGQDVARAVGRSSET